MKYCGALLLLLSVVLLSVGPSSVSGARILSIFAFPGPSQYIFASTILKELAQRGHQVTSITNFGQPKPLKNFRDVVVKENLKVVEVFLDNTFNETNKRSTLQEFNILYDMGIAVSRTVLENKEVQQMLKSPTEKFDLVIVETFVIEALFGFAAHFDAPIIGISTMGTAPFIDRLVGNISPLSITPNMMIETNGAMSFTQRLYNLAINAIDHIHYNYNYLPRQRALYKEYFPKVTRDLDQLMKNFSLVLLNQHFSLSYPRPFVPNMIEVGGLQIKQKTDPLPDDLQKFLDEATEGAIYFSMGSNLKGKDLPVEKLNMFLNALRSVKQKVLWKFEDSNWPNKPANVLIRNWFPQDSVLAHPNVKLFISHGGLLSTTESVFHGKPILGLPMFGDQHMNVANAVRDGYALSLDFKNLEEAKLKEILHELLEQPKYTERVRHKSQLLRDQPSMPLETAIYWIEYVLRHKGAPHMRNYGLDLNCFQFHSLDTALVLYGGIIAVLAGFVWSVCMLVRLIFCSKCKSTKRPSRKKKRD